MPWLGRRTEFQTLGRRCGRSVHSSSDLLRALELEFEKASRFIVGIKICLAYVRDLDFDEVSEREAEEVFVNTYNQKL